MDVYIYGITGEREVVMPLENLEVDDLDVGREILFKGVIYEIRSINELEKGILINVVQTMD